jgi:enoyl-CoA hydratase/carnithine racemase
MAALNAELKRLDGEEGEEVGCVVLAGEGERAFAGSSFPYQIRSR